MWSILSRPFCVAMWSYSSWGITRNRISNIFFLLYLINLTFNWKTPCYSRLKELWNEYPSLFDLYGSNCAYPLLTAITIFQHITLTSQWPSWRLKSPAMNFLCNRLFKLISKKTSKPALLILCEGNSPVTGEFPSQRTSDAENVSIWWRHNELIPCNYFSCR